MKKLLKKIYLKVPIFRQIHHLNKKLDQQQKILQEMQKLNDWQYRDLIELISNEQIKHNSNIKLETNNPIAYESNDHKNPFGTLQDNTRNPKFIKRCIDLYGSKMSFLDLGCSGGGLVFDFALRGYEAIGLEGSDLSKKSQRANWRTIPNNLFTCDITKSFQLTMDNELKKFKVISCWEVLEHIKEEDLPIVFNNVKKHLADGGIFIGSISKCLDDPLHVTIKEKKWWQAKMLEAELQMVETEETSFEFLDFCRGVGGGLFDSHNYNESPEKGFHFIARMPINE
ncbi:hypothetical protein PM10SUCC1_23080 [Propionigenium maris DSM 9537]|uniref:Methyltransferase domain-containing protein n=1 Tax=Propionigenium maris DSM 9537 TaxID=1123000 RepID=A0A9W6LND7_9FUSO|nr:methyltransferase domain-containing protein [Propionigenium maris]GLI56794.1 hypothetical protein PM10SUCC1_23080 [Propionigenium maris DSM 9537]